MCDRHYMAGAAIQEILLLWEKRLATLQPLKLEESEHVAERLGELSFEKNVGLVSKRHETRRKRLEFDCSFFSTLRYVRNLNKILRRRVILL